MRLGLSFLILLGTLYAERVILKDGAVRVGKLMLADAQSITLQVNGRPEKINQTDVSLVIFDTIQTEPAPRTRSVTPLTPIGGAGVPPGGDPVAPVVSQFVSTIDGLRVELLKCSKQAQTAIVCDLRVTNIEPDQAIVLRGNFYEMSRYVDATGMERKALRCRIGSKSADDSATSTLVQDVPVSAMVAFQPVDAGVTSLAKLTFSIHKPNGNKEVAFEFRRVPLQGS